MEDHGTCNNNMENPKAVWIICSDTRPFNEVQYSVKFQQTVDADYRRISIQN